MSDFVWDIGSWGREVNPEFLVVAQNAAEIIDEVSDYLDAIDGLAQEQLHYDGSPDEDGLPGDCPLPRTDAEINSPEFLASLPDPVCQELSTLQVSTEWYLGYLRPIRDAGVKVLVVDYAVVPENVNDAFQRCLAEGFVPYAGPRQLDRIGSILSVSASAPTH
jgi:endo-alpha-1,4-polygalactosaminidase (GH114 family)